MTPSQGVAAFKVALAISREREVEPLVAPLSGALHRAVGLCPASLRDLGPDEVLQVAFNVEHGKVSATAVTGGAEGACLARALDGASIPDEGSFKVLAQIAAHRKDP